VDYGEIVQRFPQVYRPDLLGRTLDQVADACEMISRFLGSNEHWHEEVKKVFGVPSGDGTVVYLDVLGVRAWYRTLLLGGNPRSQPSEGGTPTSRSGRHNRPLGRAPEGGHGPTA
jgi:hypothetical protein